MKTIATVFLIFNFILVQSQIDTVWTKCIGGSGDEVVGAFETSQALCKGLSDNTFYVVSNTRSWDGMISDSLGSLDVIILRMNALGDTLWTKIVGGEDWDAPTDIEVDAQGNLYVCGFSYSLTGDFGPHHGDNSKMDGFLIKLSPEGQIVWARQYGGSPAMDFGGNDIIHDIEILPNGNIISVGTTNSNNGDLTMMLDYFSVGWFLEVSSVGNVISSKKVKGADHNEFNENEFLRMVHLPSGKYIIAGFQWYMLQVTLWIVQLDEEGNKEWEKVYKSNADIFVTDMLYYNNQLYLLNYINAGGVSVTAPFNGGYSDFWMLRCDTTGTINQQVCWGGSESEMPVRLYREDDYFYALGSTLSSDGYVHGDSLGLADMFMVKFNSSLDTVFTWKNGGNNADVIHSATILPDSGMIIVGKTSSNDHFFHNNYGGSDIFSMRLIDKTVGISEIEDKNIKIFPNPCETFIQINNDQSFDSYRIVSFDGKEVKSGDFNGGKISTTELAEGIYLITLYNRGSILITRRFVKK